MVRRKNVGRGLGFKMIAIGDRVKLSSWLNQRRRYFRFSMLTSFDPNVRRDVLTTMFKAPRDSVRFSVQWLGQVFDKQPRPAHVPD